MLYIAGVILLSLFLAVPVPEAATLILDLPRLRRHSCSPPLLDRHASPSFEMLPLALAKLILDFKAFRDVLDPMWH
jgi:hypothetical protein